MVGRELRHFFIALGCVAWTSIATAQPPPASPPVDAPPPTPPENEPPTQNEPPAENEPPTQNEPPAAEEGRPRTADEDPPGDAPPKTNETEAQPPSAPREQPAPARAADAAPASQGTTTPAEPASPPAPVESPATSSDTVYSLDARVDIPLFVIPAALSVGWLLVDTPADCAPLCDPATVNGFDRSAAGNFDQNWRLASDLTLFGSLGGGITVLLADGWFLGGLQDFVVVAESIIWANGLAALGNLAVRRPRPLLYSETAPLDAREDAAASLSFISGHSALVAAVTTSVFSTTYRRDPDRALPWVVLGLGTAATTMAGVGRVLAGRHFPSDVLLGTALGASTGFLIPAIHDAPVRLTPVVTQNEGQVMATGTW